MNRRHRQQGSSRRYEQRLLKKSTQGRREGYTMTCDDRKHEPTRKSNFSALSPPGHVSERAIEFRELQFFLMETVVSGLFGSGLCN